MGHTVDVFFFFHSITKPAISFYVAHEYIAVEKRFIKILETCKQGHIGNQNVTYVIHYGTTMCI